ncbi:nuclear transport factor 2 family protein [Pseudonocardia pini]|uniref:nuclear transport factor 2 family protein n=1 Tax=Pseudonocardia pini TaxID=2758030 RepID=UPI0015F0380E|nr:nuclear transport factor 2 family protein [Pseudonocardia pini]
MTTPPRDEIESAFRHYFLTGPVYEDWAAWAELFTPDATYTDHFWGTFHGPAEIRRFLEGTMSFAPHVYSPLVWYVLDGTRIVYKVLNRADNPVAGRPPLEFPSLQVITYAGDGRWSSEDDWWTVDEMRRFNQAYAAARVEAGEAATDPLSRADWGTVDWARPAAGHAAAPSWQGSDVEPIGSMRAMTFGVRHPRPA